MAIDRLGRVPTIVLALLVPVVAAVTVVVTLNVTSDPTRAPVTGNGRAPATDAIRIASFEYHPDLVVVHTGDEVTVTNDDGTAHTLTADDGSFDTGELDGGASGTITITTPGTYRYFCNIHNFMTGTIEAR